MPAAVCGNPQHRHGIILAKNEAAKSTAFKRRRLWPAPGASARSCTFAPHHELYRAYSKQVNAIYARYTEFVEPFGIDESWLDMTAPGICSALPPWRWRTASAAR